MNAETYIMGILEKWPIGTIIVNGGLEGSGYSTEWETMGLYRMWVPQDKFFEFGKLDEAAMRHECGHVIFHYLYIQGEGPITEILKHLKENRKWFVRLQRLWYWNPVVRFFKRRLGFSTKINYKPTDKYDGNLNSLFTRADNELFCDWYAKEGFEKWGDGQQ